MSDKPQERLTWKWDLFHGGMSTDEYLGTSSQFADCKNIDVTQFPKGVACSSAFYKAYDYDSSVGLIDAYPYAAVSKVYAHGTGGKVYVSTNTSGTTWTTTSSSPTNWGDVRSMIPYFWGYYFFLDSAGDGTNYYVHRMTSGNYGSGSFGSATSRYLTLKKSTGNNGGTWTAMACQNAFLMFAVGKDVFVCTKADATGASYAAALDPAFTLESEVVGITYFNNNAKIYTAEGNCYVYSFSGTISTGVGLTTNYSLKTSAEFSTKVVQDYKTDYVFSSDGSYSSCYTIDGYNKGLVFSSKNLANLSTGSAKFQFMNAGLFNSVKYAKNSLWAGDQQYAPYAGIYAFESKTAGLPQAIYKKYVMSATASDTVSCIDFSRTRFAKSATPVTKAFASVQHYDGSSNPTTSSLYVISIDSTTFDPAAEHYVTSRVFYGPSVADYKNPMEIDVGFDLAGNNETIAIYASVNSGAFQLVRSFTPASESQAAAAIKRLKIGANEFPTGIREWNTIQFKVALTPDGVQNRSPKFLDLSMDYVIGKR